ncbi:hypothetical protein scyTo_0014912 [Scyliorhinus torazame]|uniref:Uncharacterized protein n=1 Tax=Scyliorhinus torazame TaxID=75743 RepID=A0A401NXJ3_SCYTO|nr:hypothetical protein [Scyliorhinus torazame]
MLCQTFYCFTRLPITVDIHYTMDEEKGESSDNNLQADSGLSVGSQDPRRCHKKTMELEGEREELNLNSVNSSKLSMNEGNDPM